MHYMVNHPGLLSVACALAMWAMAFAGIRLRIRSGAPPAPDKGSLGIVLSANLTLLGLIIGFTFSMATTRYDQRRVLESREASAIQTEFRRADLIPDPAAAATVRQLLVEYTDARVAFYTSDYGEHLDAVDHRGQTIERQLWQGIVPLASAHPDPVSALILSGMNDVLGSQELTQSAWWNRIPVAAWTLLICIALLANILLGYSTHHSRAGHLLLLVLPLLIATSFFLIADLDSPRGGVIRIPPRDLRALSLSLHQQIGQPLPPS